MGPLPPASSPLCTDSRPRAQDSSFPGCAFPLQASPHPQEPQKQALISALCPLLSTRAKCRTGSSSIGRQVRQACGRNAATPEGTLAGFKLIFLFSRS